MTIPSAIVAAACFGFLGFQVGKLLMLAVPFPQLAILMGFVAGVDAAGAVMILLGRKFGFILPELNTGAGRMTALAFFALIGAKCARGMGIEVLLWTALLNGIFMLPIVFWLIPIRSDSRATESDVEHPTKANPG